MYSQSKRMVRKYRHLARVYDLWEIAFALPGTVDPRRALADKIPDSGLAILDLCCGTGNGIIALADTSNQVIGVDISPQMLARAQRKIRQRAIDNIALERMDAARLGFADQCFDVVTSSFAMHEFEPGEMRAVLAEARRVLEPGGKLYIADYARQHNPVTALAFAAYLRVSYPAYVRDFLGYDWHEILGSAGLELDSIEPCFMSALITATATDR